MSSLFHTVHACKTSKMGCESVGVVTQSMGPHVHVLLMSTLEKTLAVLPCMPMDLRPV